MHPNDSHRETQRLGKGMLFIFWLMIIGLLTWAFGNWEDHQRNPNTDPISSVNNEYREVILNSNQQHHYLANGFINGQGVTFLLDTGATDVVIPQTLANKLDLIPGQPKIAHTANGTVRVYATSLNSLQLGSIQLYNVRASINPGMQGNQVLLGMSALRSIDFQQRNGQLILRQHAQ